MRQSNEKAFMFELTADLITQLRCYQKWHCAHYGTAWYVCGQKCGRSDDGLRNRVISKCGHNSWTGQ
jgi:hypothetical protein